MRGYGVHWDEVLALPVNVFWMMVRSLDRLYAEDDLRSSIAARAAAATKEGFEEFTRHVNERMGTLMVREEVLDRDGLAQLKAFLASG